VCIPPISECKQGANAIYIQYCKERDESVVCSRITNHAYKNA
jgi:hypothetical protein